MPPPEHNPQDKSEEAIEVNDTNPSKQAANKDDLEENVIKTFDTKNHINEVDAAYTGYYYRISASFALRIHHTTDELFSYRRIEEALA